MYCCFSYGTCTCILYIFSCHNYMYYVCETQKMLENVKRSYFGYTREQRYTKVIYYYYYYQLYCCLSSHFTVPQQGGLLITTEFGRMQVDPNEICVIQVSIVSCLSYLVCMLNHVFLLVFFPAHFVCILNHISWSPAQFVCMLNHVSQSFLLGWFVF